MRALIAAALSLTLAVPALAGTPVSLRASPASRGGTVTMADVFDGAVGPAAKAVLAPAAAPGLNAVLDAGRVQMAARSVGLDWDNAQGLRRILVSSGASNAPAGPASSARSSRQTQALAYARNINTGEIIQAADLVWSNDVIAGPNAPGDPDRLIGQAARHPLRGGAGVQFNDLAAASVIHRDETIEVAFESGGISLVLQGKAMKDAAVGESVQVMNLQSKKVIEAVASGPGKAVVGPRADALKAAPFATASLR
ncbi:MAG TPA: flagellar basal body P-ring formation chaperone FlgA [Caulobacteraceae bacterium]|jgi:flagella basal body P-ring formation protein FlgA|nr:flagellar basal body P-ring formation chaperone FlgA [Caulobacteraceae bacterium]